jgi:CRP-like cAMP-binding protein
MDQPTPRDLQRNAVLAGLSNSDFALLRPHLEPASLKLRQRLQVANQPIQNVYFPESGLASVVAIGVGRRQQAEVAMIGRESMTGLSVVLGSNRSPYDVFMQSAGEGQSISSDNLGACMDTSATLLRSFLRFAHCLAVQSAYTALANARGKLDERLARWLLMADDRLDGERLPLTHEFLALMLGTRRSGVTVAMGHFEARGLITTARGAITVTDRQGLEGTANGLYGVPEAEVRRLFAA